MSTDFASHTPAAVLLPGDPALPPDLVPEQGLLLVPELGMAEVVTVSLMVIVVAILASVQPAWKASRMEPITALRHV